METENSLLFDQHSNNARPKKRFSLTYVIILAIICIAVTGIITNIDRIIDKLSDNKSNDSGHNNEVIDAYDIVIIGAGLTGLSTSHFLSTTSDLPSKYSILTVERFNRVCGRTFSTKLKYNQSSIIFENGAMRFQYNSLHQKLLKRMDLCDNIIPIIDTWDRVSPPKDSANFLFRNIRKRIGDVNITNYWGKLYNLDPKELEWLKQGIDPMWIGYNEILVENNNGIPPQTSADWNDFWNIWTLRGVLLKDWSYQAVMKQIVNVSVEYSNYLNTLYGVGKDDASLAKMFENTLRAANSINSSANATTIGVWTLNNGYDSICRRLYDNASNYDENDFWFQQKVVGIDYNSASDRNGKNYKYIVRVQDVFDANITRNVYTNHVISTISTLQLKSLLPYMKPIDTAHTRYLVDSVSVNYRGYKLNLIFDSSFWIQWNLTDFVIPMGTDQNIYGFYIESAWTNGTLTTFHIFSRNSNGALFHRLQALDDPYEYPSDMEFDNRDGLLVSSKFVVNEAIKQLRRLTNVNNIPYPIAAFSSPMGYNESDNDGLYRWKYGYNPEYVFDQILQPIKSENIFIASSSYSNDQGWQYGAIWAAIQNLKRNFNINDSLRYDDECFTF